MATEPPTLNQPAPKPTRSHQGTCSVIVDEVRTLVPGDIIEGEWKAGPDDRIVIQLEGTRPFGWNIHGHADDETTTIIEELDKTSARHDFAPPAETTWNLLVAKQGGEALDLTVHMELYGDACSPLPLPCSNSQEIEPRAAGRVAILPWLGVGASVDAGLPIGDGEQLVVARALADVAFGSARAGVSVARGLADHPLDLSLAAEAGVWF